MSPGVSHPWFHPYPGSSPSLGHNFSGASFFPLCDTLVTALGYLLEIGLASFQ